MEQLVVKQRRQEAAERETTEQSIKLAGRVQHWLCLTFHSSIVRVELDKIVKSKQTAADVRETELTARKNDLHGLEAFLNERQERLAEEKARLDNREQETKLQFDTVRAQREESERMLTHAKTLEVEAEHRYAAACDKERHIEKREAFCAGAEQRLQIREQEIESKSVHHTARMFAPSS